MCVYKRTRQSTLPHLRFVGLSLLMLVTGPVPKVMVRGYFP